MLRFRPSHAAPFLIAALLAGCGGGGGGGSSGGGATTPDVSPALTFTPATVTGSVTAGVSLTASVIATVTRPNDFSNATSVLALVVDSAGVLLPNAQLVQDSSSQFHAVLQTAPTLAAGNYKGSFSVRLCRDSGCASQFPGSPVALPYDITVLPAGGASFTAVPAMPLNASIQSGGTAPVGTAVAITTGGADWSAVSGASWLQLSATSGSGNGGLTVSYNATGLAVGAYTTNLSVTSGGNTITLPATLTVLQPGLVLGSNSVTFSPINGAPVPSQIVSLDTDNKLTTAWTATSNTAWLSVSPTSGATPATTILTVDPTVGTLASGSYAGAITIQAAGLAARSLPVTLNLTPATLQTSLSTLTLGGTYGRDFSLPLVPQPIKLTLNTGTNSWPWKLSNVPLWASASATGGTVNASGADLSVKAVAASAPAGTTGALVTASAKVNGDTVTTPLQFVINKDLHKLLPAETAVALVSTPTWSRITRTITVNDNFNNFGGMSATSDKSWLVVGVSGNQLTVTADASQQLTDTLATATITVKPSDPDATAPEVIRVALWKGTAAPAAASTTGLPYTTVATDPLRPYAYVHNGGAYIDVYNLYTGLKETSITGFSAHLGDMAISPNGDALYVVDIDNSRITTVSLATRAISGQLAVAGSAATRIKLIRPNGIGMLVLSDGQLYLTANNTRLANLPLNNGTLAASADGKRLVQQSEGGATVQHTTISVDYSALAGGTLFAAQQTSASHTSPGTLGQDVWVNADGTQVIYAASTPNSCAMMDGANLGIVRYLAIGNAVPNNVAVLLDGRIACAGAARGNSNDLYLYNSTGTQLIQQYKLNSAGKALLPRQLAASGDGWILVGITEDGAVTFLPVGP